MARLFLAVHRVEVTLQGYRSPYGNLVLVTLLTPSFSVTVCDAHSGDKSLSLVDAWTAWGVRREALDTYINAARAAVAVLIVKHNLDVGGCDGSACALLHVIAVASVVQGKELDQEHRSENTHALRSSACSGPPGAG